MARGFYLSRQKLIPTLPSFWSQRHLFDLALKVLALYQVGDVVLIITLLTLLHVLVALGELSEGGERVGAELVKNAGNKLRELLVLAVSVDGEGVVGDSGMN